MEFIFQRGMVDVFRHTATAFSRTLNNLQPVRKSAIYEFRIGRDKQRNCEALLEFLASAG